jgi:hypothetical protein
VVVLLLLLQMLLGTYEWELLLSCFEASTSGGWSYY